MTESQSENKSKNFRELYYLRKSQGLCTRCSGKAKAESGKTLCTGCLKEKKEYRTGKSPQIEKHNSKVKGNYRHRKSENVCVYCGNRKAAPGKVSCPECSEKQKTEALENYHFYRSHHICTRCKIREAEPKKTICLECSFRLIAEYKPKTEAQKERKKITDKQRYKKLKAEGLCTNCRRKARRGMTLCTECAIKMCRRQRDKKEYPNLSRNERPSYGMCYICGEPLKEGKKLCEKHYTTACEKIVYASTFIDRDNHIWRKLDNMSFAKTTLFKNGGNI